MWLIPKSMRSAFVPESACLTKESELPLRISEWKCEQQPLLNGKLLPRTSLLRLWKREPWMKRLCGAAIFDSSTQKLFEDRWIASLPDSLVRTCPSPVDALGLTGRDPGSSSMSSTLPMIAVRGASFWRTSQASLLPPPPLWTKPKASLKSVRPPESWENWPTVGGTRNGSLFPRPTWVPVMEGPDGSASRGAWARWDTPDTRPDAPGTGSHRTQQVPGLGNQAKIVTQGLWPTPDVCSGERDMSAISADRQRNPSTKVTIGLPTVASLWATPRAEMDQGSASEKRRKSPSVACQASMWATPNAHDGRRPGADLLSTQGGNLNRDAATWPTPDANVMNDGESPETWHARRETLKAKGINGNGAGIPLTVAAVSWPTPVASDSGQKVTLASHQPGLIGAAHHFSRQVLSSLDGRDLSPTIRTLPPRLNPAFACWLMGWPTWWTNPGLTNSVKSEMASWRCALRSQLSSLSTVPATVEEEM
jgi:hypothetical protein